MCSYRLRVIVTSAHQHDHDLGVISISDYISDTYINFILVVGKQICLPPWRLLQSYYTQDFAFILPEFNKIYFYMTSDNYKITGQGETVHIFNLLKRRSRTKFFDQNVNYFSLFNDKFRN